jgi:RimJ/RimL family protein N-acetyltransferase
MGDLDDEIAFINELVDERAEILVTSKVKRDEEAEWLGKRLAEIEKGSLLALVAELDGRIVGSADVSQRTPDVPVQSHVGALGIAILEKARGVGLGKMMIEELLQLSKQAGLKVVILDMFATNTGARQLYEKVGFVEVGRIPKGIKRDGKYIDLIRFAIEI